MTTSVEPKPGARRCANCNSRNVSERKTSPRHNFVVLKIACQMCRQEFTIWSGTAFEYKIFKRNRSKLKRAVERSHEDD